LPPHLRRKLAVGMLGELLWQMWRPPQEWNPFLRWSYKVGYYLVVALFDVFPLPQQSGVRESFAYAGESVDCGFSVLVYPEGQRTLDGQGMPFRSGFGMLAARLNVPVLPLRIDGLWEMKISGRKIARPGQLKVVIGKPMRFPPGTPPDEITNQVEDATWSM
jgi:long-chain acyl-CoA synthetase